MVRSLPNAFRRGSQPIVTKELKSTDHQGELLTPPSRNCQYIVIFQFDLHGSRANCYLVAITVSHGVAHSTWPVYSQSRQSTQAGKPRVASPAIGSLLNLQNLSECSAALYSVVKSTPKRSFYGFPNVRCLEVVLVGDATVGKTHLLSRYIKGTLPKVPCAGIHGGFGMYLLRRSCERTIGACSWSLWMCFVLCGRC